MHHPYHCIPGPSWPSSFGTQVQVGLQVNLGSWSLVYLDLSGIFDSPWIHLLSSLGPSSRRQSDRLRLRPSPVIFSVSVRYHRGRRTSEVGRRWHLFLAKRAKREPGGAVLQVLLLGAQASAAAKLRRFCEASAKDPHRSNVEANGKDFRALRGALWP